MLFNSYIFVLLFFPLCLVGYFGLNYFKRYTLAQLYLFLMSLWFYGYFNPSYLPIMLGSILVNYSATWLMDRAKNPRLKKAELIAALLFNLGVLFYYKYMDCVLSNINALFRTDFPLFGILLPLGISFFTFQQISYVVDAYRGEVQQYNFLQYASFVAYFPQLVAGPIVTHDELIPQFMDLSKKLPQWENFSKGLFIFVLGLAKKVLVADTFGNAANWGFANIPTLDATNGLITMLAYCIQIYYDFGGYSDMAIGLGKMMNFDLPVNFDSPYKSITILEFWNRWHKTLTRFFTKYLYIPLGGSRKGKFRTYVNVFTIYLVSGLWHGASWNYVLWGVLQGLFVVITRLFKKGFDRIPKVLNWAMTFGFINITPLIFRTRTVAEGFQMIGRVFSLEFAPISGYVSSAFNLPEIVFVLNLIFPFDWVTTCPHVLMFVAFALTYVIMLFTPNAYERMQAFRPKVSNLVGIWLLLMWCILSFASVSSFLYFNF